VIEHWDDEAITVIFTHDEYAVYFRAVEIIATAIVGPGDFKADRGWTKKGAVNSSELVYDPMEAERYIDGHVKWDGCSNINFGDESSDGYMHFCGREGIEQMSKVLLRVFARCGELLGDRALKGAWHG
jgi:hypothetical protein